MRLRQAVQALLRRRRIDERESSYRDIVWENAIEAYESTPEPDVGPVVDITPYIQARLDAAKEELLLKAHRTKRERDLRRRESRRRVMMAMTAASLTLLAVGGASALTGFGTGVDSLDRVLGTLREKDDGSGPSQRPTAADRTLATDSTIALEAPIGLGGQVAGSFYLSRSGYICFVRSTFSGEGIREPTGGGSCAAPDAVAASLRQYTAYVTGVATESDGTVVVAGLASPKVEDLRVRGEGPMDVRLSGPWTPRSGSISPMRGFIATGSLSLPSDTREAGEVMGRVAAPTNYRLAVREDGIWRSLTSDTKQN
jgi:hypothetical protein